MRFVRQVGTAWFIVTSAACGGEALQEGLTGADTGGGHSSRAASDDASIVLPRRGDATAPGPDGGGGAPSGHDAGGTLRADAPTFSHDGGDRGGGVGWSVLYVPAGTVWRSGCDETAQSVKISEWLSEVHE